MVITNRGGRARKEKDILDGFLAHENLRHSGRRDKILEKFLSTEGHVSAEDLYDILKKKDPGIGVATVYRSLKLFVKCGLAREVNLGSRKSYYEHRFEHGHHDHLICVACGKTAEFCDPEIEKLQRRVAAKHGYKLTEHNLEILGLCGRCR